MTEVDSAALAARAQAVRRQAYAPYSRYTVGAALLAASGRVYAGANVENAVYPLTICAERAAVVQAVAEGERAFAAIAVATENGGSPCGACRQVLAEFGLETIVLFVDGRGAITRRTTVGALLPEAFGPQHLPAAGPR